MKYRSIFGFLVIFGAGFGSSIQTLGADVPASRLVTLSGTVIERQTYGPPGFGETPATDSKVTYYAIELAEPLTRKQLLLKSSQSDSNKQYIVLQLYCEDSRFPKCESAISSLAGRKATIVGEVNDAQYPLDFLPTVVTVRLIEHE
jgi:hypothetical protein